MASGSPSDLLERLRAFCSTHPGPVVFDQATQTLFDVFSAEALSLASSELRAVEEKLDRETQAPYLKLEFGDGRQLALTQAGIAFSPDFRNSGPVSLPLAVCFRDFRTLIDRLKHELYGHPERSPSREMLQISIMCIAILDGARAQGFDVAREEKELERHLTELEKRGTPRV